MCKFKSHKFTICNSLRWLHANEWSVWHLCRTDNTPWTRFDSMSTVRTRHGLESHGIQLLYSLMWPWQKVPGARRLYYEAALHRALELNNSVGQY